MKLKNLILPLFLLMICGTGICQKQDLENYPVELIYVPELVRPDVKFEKGSMPEGTTGSYPSFDGEFFHLNLSSEQIMKSSEENARQIVDLFLHGLTWQQPKNAIRSLQSVLRPTVEEEVLGKIIKESTEKTRSDLNRSFNKINEDSEAAIEEQNRLARLQSQQHTSIFVYEQYYKELPIDNAIMKLTWRDNEGFTSLNGRVFNMIKMGNRFQLNEKQAIEAASRYILKYDEIEPEGTEIVKKVILPYGETFYYTWKIRINTKIGAYEVWVDAQSGKVLKLIPLFYSVNANGLRFDLNPNGATTDASFEVDAASGGFYRLQLSGVLDVTNAGADGSCTGDLTLADNGSGSADFNIAPINNTVVNRTNLVGYNCRFQDVNVYAWIYSHIKTFNDLLGSVTMPSLTVTVNHNNPCGFGISNACANWGTWSLTFGIGQATISNSNSCNDLFNSALDGTILTHEFGHLVNARNNSGTFPLHMHEGLADFWGYTMYNTNTVGAYWGQNCATNSQGGWLPREVEGLDVFPEHRALSTSAYGDGQIIGWALWNVRREFNEMSALGTFLINSYLLDAIAAVTFGDLASAKQRHDNFLALEQQITNLFQSSVNIHKVLSGFARAGILLAPADAVIDINDDYLDRIAGTPPTFTVWTGRDYVFNADGSVNTGTQPFNTRYEIEVANDAAFTDNLRSSGLLTGVVAADGGTASWTMSVADWNVLKIQNRLYYKVRTTNSTGGNVRTSINPGNSFYTDVPVAYAIINDSGECECACSCGAAADAPGGMAAVTIIPLLFGIGWMIRIRKRKS